MAVNKGDGLWAGSWGLLLLAPLTLAAQQPTAEKLKPADARTGVLLGSYPRQVRELRDGRVLFINGKGFSVVDLKKGSVDSVTGVPPGALFPLPADSSLIVTPGSWVFIEGVRTLGMLPASNPVVAASPSVVGADTSGLVVTLREHSSDSSDVIRVNRRDATEERLARIRKFPGVRGGEPGPVYSISERVTYTLDGWLAILRTAPYRVDWRSPSGTWTLGKAVLVPPIRFDAKEKLAYLAEGKRTYGWAPDSPDQIKNWPEFVEPSTGMQLPWATPDGKLLVFRTSTADFPHQRYDVVDRDGMVERQITLGDDETIAGFGAKSIYTMVRISRTETRLERHPWP